MLVAFVFAACLAIFAMCFWLTFGELEQREAQRVSKRTLHGRQVSKGSQTG
jgi:hypothetical protein